MAKSDITLKKISKNVYSAIGTPGVLSIIAAVVGLIMIIVYLVKVSKKCVLNVRGDVRTFKRY